MLRTAGLFLALIAAMQSPWAKDVVGWVERAELYPGAIVVDAKLDTGAENSSLDMTGLRRFRRSGRDWVGFRITNRDGDDVWLELPLLRMAKIKRHFGQAQERPVVRLSICVGNVLKEVEVNLVDRSGFQYRLLVGRSYLAHDFLIDPGARYRTRPACDGGSGP